MYEYESRNRDALQGKTVIGKYDFPLGYVGTWGIRL